MVLVLVQKFFGLFLIQSLVDNLIEIEFDRFRHDFNRTYQVGSLEYDTRLINFKESVNRFIQKNKIDGPINGAIFGITNFSDWAQHEFDELIKGRTRRPRKGKAGKKLLKSGLHQLDLPNKLDWRERDVIGPVVNQGDCGGCWAMSVVQTIESMAAIKNNQPVEKLSFQQLIDCSGENHGCDGGDTCTALQWLSEYKINLQKESDYPFLWETGLCNRSKSNQKGVQIHENFTCESFTDHEFTMVKNLQNGPLIAAVDASSWQDYVGGVIKRDCSDDVNHAVQIVGYDDLKGKTPYFIVRNSWGESFGHDGYIHIAIGSNLCGISTEVSQVWVK